MVITWEEYRQARQDEPITASIGSIAAPRRVYGEVSANVYRMFCARLAEEGVPRDKVGEAFSKLVEEYAYGATLHRPGKPHADSGVDYLHAHS